MCPWRWLATHLDRISLAKYVLRWSWGAGSHMKPLAKNIKRNSGLTIRVLEPGQSRIRSSLPSNTKRHINRLWGVWSASEVVGTEACLLLALWLPVLHWVFRGSIPSTHQVTSATWNQWVALIMQWVQMGKSNLPGILEEIMDWPESWDFRALPERWLRWDEEAKIRIAQVDLDWEQKRELFIARWARERSGHLGRDATYRWACDWRTHHRVYHAGLSTNVKYVLPSSEPHEWNLLGIKGGWVSCMARPGKWTTLDPCHEHAKVRATYSPWQRH